MKKIFYHLSDPTQNVPEGDDNWIEQLKQNKIMCDCWSIIKPSVIDVYLNSKIKKGFAPITAARGTKIGMLRKDIINLIGISNLEKIYFIGKVYDVNKNQSEEYISLVPKTFIYVRGGEESTCRICEKCRTVLYFPLPLTNWYLIEKDIPNKVVFPSNMISGIIVNEIIYRAIKKSGIKKTGYEKLLIKEKAIDGCDSYFECPPASPSDH